MSTGGFAPDVMSYCVASCYSETRSVLAVASDTINRPSQPPLSTAPINPTGPLQMQTFTSDLSMDHARRFGAIGRLYGLSALQRFECAHVCVVGIGGVGSWVAEALARSAIGQITMIDLDHVAESNVNRQVHACDATLGQAKVSAMAERIAGINADCIVHQFEEFIAPDNLDALIPPGRFDYVIDAIDSVRAKVSLISYCARHGIPLLTIGGAGGQLDATRVRVVDLAHTEHEPLLAKVRRQLRTEHGFPRNIRQRFGIDAVFSDEPLIYPEAACAAGDSENGSNEAGGVTGLNCAGFGSSVAVTGVFGLMAAGHVLRKLAAPVAPAQTAMMQPVTGVVDSA